MMKHLLPTLRAGARLLPVGALVLLLGLVQGPFSQGQGKATKHSPVKPYESGIAWEEPPQITPGQHGSPPSDAIVLFDGKNMDAWKGGEKWVIKEGAAIASSVVSTKRPFGDCQLHLEFATPQEIKGSGQGRGNNGVGFMDARYEIQVLDAWNNPTYLDGMCASIYKQRPPLVNATRRPGEWQTYDIVFEAPRFHGDKLDRPAYVTVFWNGVVVQNHVALLGDTPYDRPPRYTPHPEKLPLVLMYHGNPVRFRNIWIRDLKELHGEHHPEKSTVNRSGEHQAGRGAAGQEAGKPQVLDLWPGQPPGAKANGGPEKFSGPRGGRALTNISRPTLTVFRPAPDKNTGLAVVIAPGGGYRILAWDHEGLAVAHWLNSIGVTGILLKYRVPVSGGLDSWSGESFAPRQDAQRALSLVRSKAKDWGIDPHHIGMLGFSAGGHLTALAATHFDKRSYEPVDEADRESCRPDFAVVIYPGGMVKRGSDQLDPAFHVTREMKVPPTFLVQCSDDPVGVQNSVEFYRTLKQAGYLPEMHIYAKGGHGFGMRPGKGPAAEWPQRCEEWLREEGILRPAATH